MKIFLSMTTIFFSMLVKAETQPLRVVSEILPPFQMINVNGEFKGKAVDMVNAILNEAGHDDIEIEVMPWARAYKKAQREPNVAIFSLAYSQKRAELFNWIGPLYGLERSSLIGLKSRAELDVPTLEEAKKFRVCSELETHSYQYLKSLGYEPNKNLLSVRSVLAFYHTNNGGIARPAQNLTLLNAKKCDYVTGLWSIYAYSENANHNLKPYFYLGQPDKPLLLNLALSLHSDPAMLDGLKKAYNTLKDSGELYRICMGDDREKLYERSCKTLLPTKTITAVH
ncbi:substrate-binding periplasmic protein [Enterovibrio sp. 27052020O]|uniref:substrate-binding periplasmic protein n=1 Tax=Enterovibrio sp. 27052020O TaxID=3241166 RepID=UPI00388D382F